jgi:hypothetical protein
MFPIIVGAFAPSVTATVSLNGGTFANFTVFPLVFPPCAVQAITQTAMAISDTAGQTGFLVAVQSDEGKITLDATNGASCVENMGTNDIAHDASLPNYCDAGQHVEQYFTFDEFGLHLPRVGRCRSALV